MKKFTIFSEDSYCITRDGEIGYSLSHDTPAYYHEDYVGGQGRHSMLGTIENLICTFKNDITPYRETTLNNAMDSLGEILDSELPEILRESQYSSLRVCVIPRAKHEEHYRPNQRLFRQTVQMAVKRIDGLEDGTMDIIRHTDTATTHLARRGNGALGSKPYVGITLDTCSISDDVEGKDILLIDDLYTKTVNIDEDCIQALYEKGARSVMFYAVGRTRLRTWN